MKPFGEFYLDREKDIVIELFTENDEVFYCLRTPNHHTGNLITNLAKLCGLSLSEDERGLKIIRGSIPCYIDGNNEPVYIFRLGNTKVANIYPDGTVERKASIPAISKTLMSQTKSYALTEQETIVKTYLFRDSKFRTDFHTHMNGNLEPDVLIALGIFHEIRYPLYYIKKLGLKCTKRQTEMLEKSRASVAKRFEGSPLTGKYLDRKIDDETFLNFADLILRNLRNAHENIITIRNSLTVPKDGQAVFTDLEKVYLYRYVFTKGVPSERKIRERDFEKIPEPDVVAVLREMDRDRENPVFRNNSIFQDKLLWIARTYAKAGVQYAEISDTTLCKKESAAHCLSEIHEVMPEITKETGVLLRFLASIRRVPLTIVRDRVTPYDYLSDNLKVLRAVAHDPYVAGSDIVGEEMNDITELAPVIRELVCIAKSERGFTIRIHAGENDSLKDNVSNAIRCIEESLSPGDRFPRVRIGHGLYTPNLTTAKGKKLLQRLIERNVVLEFQITSNVRLNNLSNLESHPLRRYLDAGVSCVQGTDGGGLYGTDSIDEELALEKLLSLRHDDLLKMRKAEQAVEEICRDDFTKKSRVFAEDCPGGDVERFYDSRIAEKQNLEIRVLPKGKKIDARDALSAFASPLPLDGTPVVVAGGSFHSDRHETVLRNDGVSVIDALLNALDPEKCFFVIGHRLTGYEKLLVEKNHGRFRIFAIVPSMVGVQESRRIASSGVSVVFSPEPSGLGLYKSFAYEIFKRRFSVLLVLDGHSSACNLMQEAANGRKKCAIYVEGHKKTICEKAKTLEGYTTVFTDGRRACDEIVSRIASR